MEGPVNFQVVLCDNPLELEGEQYTVGKHFSNSFHPPYLKSAKVKGGQTKHERSITSYVDEAAAAAEIAADSLYAGWIRLETWGSRSYSPPPESNAGAGSRGTSKYYYRRSLRSGSQKEWEYVALQKVRAAASGDSRESWIAA